MTEIMNNFFGELSKRFPKENDLSDLTFCMMQAIPEFKERFIDFVTPPKVKLTMVREIIREFPLNSCNRPDFMIEGDGWQLILENKIWDVNYHFAEYAGALKQSSVTIKGPTYLTLISAHKLTAEQEQVGNDYGFTIVYWYDFVAKLQTELELFGIPEQCIINGYIKYLKEIIKMPEIDKIDFKEKPLKSICYTNNLIKLVINRNRGSKEFEYSFDPQNRRCSGDYWTGKGYKIKNNSNLRTAFLSFYFQYDFRGKPAFIIELPLDWNPELNILTPTGNENFDFDPAGKNEGCAFIMKDQQYQQFTGSESKEEQEKILTEFFTKVNQYVNRYLL